MKGKQEERRELWRSESHSRKRRANRFAFSAVSEALTNTCSMLGDSGCVLSWIGEQSIQKLDELLPYRWAAAHLD